MPSPLAHVGVCVALWAAVAPPISGARGARRPSDVASLLAVAAAAVAPDVDLLAAVLPGGLAFHHGPTHSLIGATLLGALCAAAARRWSARVVSVCVLSGLLHVAMDWQTGEPGAPVRFGVQWAWPFSAARAIAAEPLFGAYHIDRPGFLLNLASVSAVGPLLRELVVVTGASLCAWGVRRVRWRMSRS